MERRDFLRALSLSPLVGSVTLPMAKDARAASTNKVLVCLFMYGGNDSINMLPPVAGPDHDKYAALRGNVAVKAGSSLGANTKVTFHSEIEKHLKPIWDLGKLAVVHNVGPLSQPTTKAQFTDWMKSSDPKLLPEKLFSHIDQQHLAQNSGAETMQVKGGWGGRLLEKIAGGAQVPLSFGGQSRFGSAPSANEITLPLPGTDLSIAGYSNQYDMNRKVALDTMLAQPSSNILHETYRRQQLAALSKAASWGPVLKLKMGDAAASGIDTPQLTTAFTVGSEQLSTPIAQQLFQVAKMIQYQRSSSASQIYFVSMGGFDHHDDEIGKHPQLMKQFGPAVAAFWAALTAMGEQNNVTLFTASDFGRTLKANSSGGSDHAWGASYLVMGGSVLGGKEYGQFPEMAVGGPTDASTSSWDQQGRWIPTTSTSEFSARLIKWFAPGLSDADLAYVLPTLPAFKTATAARSDLGFMG